MTGDGVAVITHRQRASCGSSNRPGGPGSWPNGGQRTTDNNNNNPCQARAMDGTPQIFQSSLDSFLPNCGPSHSRPSRPTRQGRVPIKLQRNDNPTITPTITIPLLSLSPSPSFAITVTPALTLQGSPPVWSRRRRPATAAPPAACPGCPDRTGIPAKTTEKVDIATLPERLSRVDWVGGGGGLERDHQGIRLMITDTVLRRY
jgi:hypothetical protein